MKEFQMLPIQRPVGWKPTIQRVGRPTIGSQVEKIYFKVLSIDEKTQTAIITDRKQTLTVNIARFGNGLLLGDIIAYSAMDTAHERPIITHRYHQPQTYPRHLR